MSSSGDTDLMESKSCREQACKDGRTFQAGDDPGSQLGPEMTDINLDFIRWGVIIYLTP